jgi:hypothetical protein
MAVMVVEEFIFSVLQIFIKLALDDNGMDVRALPPPSPLPNRHPRPPPPSPQHPARASSVCSRFFWVMKSMMLVVFTRDATCVAARSGQQEENV